MEKKNETAIQKNLSAFAQDEKGATSIEYAMIAAMVALVIITGLQAVAGSINESLENVGESITTGG